MLSSHRGRLLSFHHCLQRVLSVLASAIAGDTHSQCLEAFWIATSKTKTRKTSISMVVYVERSRATSISPLMVIWISCNRVAHSVLHNNAWDSHHISGSNRSETQTWWRHLCCYLKVSFEVTSKSAHWGDLKVTMYDYVRSLTSRTLVASLCPRSQTKNHSYSEITSLSDSQRLGAVPRCLEIYFSAKHPSQSQLCAQTYLSSTNIEKGWFCGLGASVFIHWEISGRYSMHA